MSEHEWKSLQEDLQALKRDAADGPADELQFKNRVLQEYERRTRREGRSRWVRRTAAVLTVGVAACVALFIGMPATDKQEVRQGTPGREDGMYAVIAQVVSLFEQNRYAEAMDLFVKKLGNKPLPAPAPKFDLIGAALQETRLAVYSENDEPSSVDKLIPQSSRINPKQEIGLTIANGTVQSFAFDGQTVKVTVLPAAGRLQVLAVEKESVKALSGHSFALDVVDPTGQEVTKRTIKIP